MIEAWWRRRRRRVLAVVALDPNLGEWEICRNSGLTRWEVRHHLGWLILQRKITSRWSSRIHYPRCLLYEVVKSE